MDDLSRGQRNRFHGWIGPEGKSDTGVLFGDEVLEVICREVLAALSEWLALIDQLPPDVDLLGTGSEGWNAVASKLTGALFRLSAHPSFTEGGFRTKQGCFFQVEAILGADDQRVIQLNRSVSDDSARIHCGGTGSGCAEVACMRLDRPAERNVGPRRVFGLHDGLFAWGAWRRSQS